MHAQGPWAVSVRIQSTPLCQIIAIISIIQALWDPHALKPVVGHTKIVGQISARSMLACTHKYRAGYVP